MSTDISDNQVKSVAASFRDPSGYVFTATGVLYRQVNQITRQLRPLDCIGSLPGIGESWIT